MRFMMQLWSREEAQPARLPDPALVSAMASYYEELTDAGVLLVAEGLLASGRGARIAVAEGERVVTEGPFADADRLTSAILILQVKSKSEALAWAQRCPLAEGDLLELRQLYDPPCFPLELTSPFECWPSMTPSRRRPEA